MAKQKAGSMKDMQDPNIDAIYQNTLNSAYAYNRHMNPAGFNNMMYTGPYVPLGQQQFPNQFGNMTPQMVNSPMSSTTNNVFDNTFITPKGSKIYEVLRDFPLTMSPVSLRMKLLMVSYTGDPVYGLTSSGNMIEIFPSQLKQNDVMPEAGIYFGMDSNGSVADLSVKRYPLPEGLSYTQIHELGMVVFHSKEMMEATIKSFGKDYRPGHVASTLLSDIDLIHSGFYGSVKVLTSSKNKHDYFTAVSDKVLRIPRVHSKHRATILTTFGISDDTLEEFDYIIIENTLNHGSFDDSYRKSRIYKVPVVEYKNAEKFAKASLVLKTGVVIFPRKEMARTYINEYRSNTREFLIKNSNSMANEFYKKESKKARKRHRKELFAVKELLIGLVTTATVGYVVDQISAKVKSVTEDKPKTEEGTINMLNVSSKFFEAKRGFDKKGYGPFNSFTSSFMSILGLVLGFQAAKWLVENRQLIANKIKAGLNTIKDKVKSFFGKIKAFFTFKPKAALA